MKSFLLFLAAIIVTSCQVQEPEITDRFSEYSGEWHDNKYSMFIHWGLYSELAGVWNGEPVKRGYSEQIQAHAGIYSDHYAQTAERFNPENWDPDAIAELAKNAGMRSIVITTKHHDGFSLFHTAYSDYNIVDATPYGRDVIKELADAARQHGLNFGIYYSLIDWHYPPAYPISSHNADPIPDEHHQFNMNQVRELLTNYGPISELWFDMGSLEPEQSKEIRELVHSLQPDCMIGGRIGNDMGDFTVLGDNEYPDFTLDTPWQTPASMFDETWGYRSWQERGDPEDKIREKLEALIQVVSGGGNYLLNIGPRGDGSVVEFEKEVLLGIGEWLDVNGEAIYGTKSAGFPEVPEWGYITQKENRLYLHLTNIPDDGIITLDGLEDTPDGAYFLDNGHQTSFSVHDSYVNVEIPEQEKTDEIRVIVLEFDGDFYVRPKDTITEEMMSTETAPGILLDRQNSHKHHSFSGVDYYSSFRSTVRESWTFDENISGSFAANLFYTDAERGRSLELITPRGIELIRLERGEEYLIREDFDDLTFGPLYVNGPHTSRIDGRDWMQDDIDLNRPWPSDNGSKWEVAEGGSGTMLTKPAGRNINWFLMQQIESESESDLLVRLERMDGVQVVLNGEEIYVHNNPHKEEIKTDLVMLPLRQGANELVVKFYNRFGREISFSLDYDLPQTGYHKKLDEIELPGTPGQRLIWQEHDPVSIHSNLAMPNLRLEMTSVTSN
jgi:alpha-L-fucosidase